MSVSIAQPEEIAHWSMRYLALALDGSEVVTECHFRHPRYRYRAALGIGAKLAMSTKDGPVSPIRLLLAQREGSDAVERCAASPQDAVDVLVSWCGIRRDDARQILRWHKPNMADHVWIRDGHKAEPEHGRGAGTIGRVVSGDTSPDGPWGDAWRDAPQSPLLGGPSPKKYLVVEVYRDHRWKAELAAEAGR